MRNEFKDSAKIRPTVIPSELKTPHDPSPTLDAQVDEFMRRWMRQRGWSEERINRYFEWVSDYSEELSRLEQEVEDELDGGYVDQTTHAFL